MLSGMYNVRVTLHSAEENECADSIFVDFKRVDRRRNDELKMDVLRKDYKVLSNEIHFTWDSVPSVMMCKWGCNTQTSFLRSFGRHACYVVTLFRL